MWLLKWPLAALLLLLGLVAASDDEGSGFTYPVEEGLTFYEKDAVTVSWKSDFDSARLLLFCWEGVEEDVLTMKKNWTNVPGQDGSFLVHIDFSTTARSCWFNLRDNEKSPKDEGANGFNSASFGLSKSGRSTTTLGLQGPASTTRSISATDETAATTAANSNSGDSSAGLSTGAKAGIGIAASLGLLGLLALGAALWVVKRRKNAAQRQPLMPEKDDHEVEAHQTTGPYDRPYDMPYEMPSGNSVPRGPPQELAG